MDLSEEWLESKINEIKEMIKKTRKFHCYLTKIYWNTDKNNFYVWYKNEENIIKDTYYGENITIYPYKTKYIDPKIIKMTLPNLIVEQNNSFYYDPKIIAGIMVVMEERLILQGIKEGKETVEIKVNDGMYESLIKSKENKPFSKNVLLVNPLFIQKLRTIKSFFPFFKSSDSLNCDKKMTYLGKIGDIEIHWNNLLDKDEGILFDKNFANLKISDLKVDKKIRQRLYFTKLYYLG